MVPIFFPIENFGFLFGSLIVLLYYLRSFARPTISAARGSEKSIFPSLIFLPLCGFLFSPPNRCTRRVPIYIHQIFVREWNEGKSFHILIFLISSFLFWKKEKKGNCEKELEINEWNLPTQNWEKMMVTKKFRKK